MHLIEYIIVTIFLIIFLSCHYSFVTLFHRKVLKSKRIYYESLIEEHVNQNVFNENIISLFNITNKRLFNYRNMSSWTIEEIEKLVSLRDCLVDWKQISEQLNRPIHYCKTKYYSIQKEQMLPYKWNKKVEKQLFKLIDEYKEDWFKISSTLNTNMSPYVRVIEYISTIIFNTFFLKKLSIIYIYDMIFRNVNSSICDI